MSKRIRSTTIVGVKAGGRVALAGDGQVTLQNTVMKHTARKVRRLYQGRIVAGFAGSVADAQALADHFERKLETVNGNLTRAELNAGLRKDFDAADTNHDGVLEMDEVRAVNNRRWSEDAAATSPLVDWNRDGVVDFDEYSATARSLFDQLDVDGKGILTAQQLRPPCGTGGPDGDGAQGGGSGGAEHRGHRGGRGRGGGPGGDGDGDGQ